MADAELLELGKAFAALGADPSFKKSDVEKWLQDKTSGAGALTGKSAGETSIYTTAVNVPRLPVFSGSEAKGEASFVHWRYEVRCLVSEGLKDSVILQAVRRSLRGQAADVLLHLGEGVAIRDLLAKLDVVFGDVLSTESVLENFYSSRQLAKESMALWACRLEDILQKAVLKGAFEESASKEMLRSKFWSGIFDPNMKMALRHHFDSGMDFSDLLTHARVVEDEFTKPKAKCAQQSEDPLAQKLDLVLQKLESVEGRVKALETKTNKRACYACGSSEHLLRDCPKKKNSGNAKRGQP